jgi:hypothetical protein
MGVRNTIKFLLRALLGELKTLIGGDLWDQNVESKTNHYRANTICDNMTSVGATSSKSHVAEYKQGDPYQKWYQTKEGRDLFMKRVAHVLAIAAVIIYFVQMEANRRQADAAEGQLREMRDEMIRGERAWITITKIDGNFLTSGDLVISIYFKNTGRTPAINVMPMATCSFDKNLIGAVDTFPVGNKYSQLIGPDVEPKISGSGIPIPAEAIKAIKNGMPYYVWGTVWYDDIFGSNHWTQYCFQVTTNIEFGEAAFHNTCDDAKGNQSKK